MNAKQKIKAARESSNVTTSERSLDHFVNLVGDIEIAAAMYKRLGFQTMPTMEHEKIGTSNVCLQFEGTYLELIGDLHLSNSDQLNDTIARWTKFGEYIYWMTSFTSSRLEMARKELQSLGLDPNEPLNAARKVRCVGGGWDTTDSSSMYTFREPNITGSFFHSEHLKPEAIWMPGYMIHPNSAIRIVGITYLADSLEADLDYQIKMIGGEPAQRSPDRVAWHTPRGEFFEVLTPSAARVQCPQVDPLPEGLPIRGSAYTVEVQNLDLCRLSLRQGGIPFAEADGIIATPAAFGAGMAMYFVEKTR